MEPLENMVLTDVRVCVCIRSRFVDSILSFGIVYLKAKMEPPCMPTYASVNICREINETYSTISFHKHANVPQIFAGRYEICMNLVFPVQCHPIKKERKKEKKYLRSRYYFKTNNCYEYRNNFSIKKRQEWKLLKINTTKWYSRIFARIYNTRNCRFFLFYFQFEFFFF